MEPKVIECPSCRTPVKYVEALLEGRLSCPGCGEPLLDKPGHGVQTKPDRRPEVTTADRGGAGYESPLRRDRDDRWEDERPRPKPPWLIVGIVLGVVLLVLGVGVAGYVAAVGKVRESAARMRSSNNLKQIGLAAHGYHDANGFMPRDVAGPDGKPLLSWRVLLLPYVEQDNLYKQFHLNEPWDSPHNLQLLKHVPKVYVVPGKEREAAQGLTFYQGFAGPGTVFDPRPGFKLEMRQIADGTADTILVAEASDGVPWTKPADMPYDPKGPLPALGGRFRGGYNVLMCDGSVRFVSATVSEQTLRAAITYNDGQMLGGDW